ncbi:Serine/threonine-protein kinase PknB [Rosistilla carotiformis]|uniref:non-specific serine/threonine protein kinase n=1 Tax=Rosistilla carotiformis TaxID=2528017 RepID=A0A518K0L5_9BACT|nr:serine/threonine-protein kinase [Rosistilla carotiformis]QDV71338.1 Serine/threonine-protein kinase PknB [Rosistilla carotiformis]
MPEPVDEKSDDREQQLAELLSELADRVARNVPVDLEQVCRQHPLLASELRRLWGAIVVAGAVGETYQRDAAVEDVAAVVNERMFQLPQRWGDYELQQEVGRGGMGVVFRARQISLNREVAVKMIAQGRLASETDQARFDSEALSAAQLEHPGIVAVYDVDEFDGRSFFSMQYVPGPTLADRIHDGLLPQREAARIVSQVARAVEFAHSRGVLHRDLKPSNILIDSHGQPLVSDFGLAKQLSNDSDVTRSGAVLGTPCYMSPEQAAGRRGTIGPASDVYSLGCVLYHALVGRPPLVSDSAVEMVMMVLEQEPLPPRTLRQGLDRDLEMIVIKCLQKPADLRYSTAAELADDLDAFLNSEPVTARSGRFAQVIGRALRETHHAAVLENWGVLWMWHSLVLLIACALTWRLQALGITNQLAFAALWTAGWIAWATVFWILRRRMGPVTFVERQIAHVWAASMLGIAALFPMEAQLGLPVLSLTPLLGVIAAMVFVVKAAMLSGAFYIQVVALLLSAVAMAVWPAQAHLIFGVVAAASFFFPGLKYYRQRRRNERLLETSRDREPS